jgi:hypothetical protein
MFDEFLKIAARTRPAAEVSAHRAYVINVNDDRALAKLTTGLLGVFQAAPGVCFMMNALLASGIRNNLGLPVAVVVGDLLVGSRQIFAAQTDQDWTKIGKASGTVDGHAWIQVGERLIEPSVLRTIRLGGVAPQVVDVVRRDIGENGGAVFGRYPLAQSFFYRPHYVLTSEQEDILATSAYKQFVEPGVDTKKAKS